MAVALITGAARGIGAATARRLAAAGWHLVLFDRCADLGGLSYPLATPADLEGVIEECGGPDHAVGVIGDVRDQDQLDAAAAQAVYRFGGLDAALAIAGCIAGGTDAWETPDALWELMISVNLEGAWRLAKAAAPALLERPEPRHGRFIAVSSSAGSTGLYRLAAYTAAKHGVNGLIRGLAAEFAPHGITANAVAPGSTDTQMLRASAGLYGLEATAEFAAHHMIDRLISPAEPAALIAWLCGPESDAITGAVLPVDAGMTAR